MAKGRRHGEWSGHHGRGWNATRWPSFARVGERILALRLGSVVRTAFQEELPKMGRADQVRRRLCGGVQDRGDAERFRHEVEERLAAFGLQVAPEKTAVLLFDGNLLHRNQRLAIKPAPFTFLGFVHFLTKTSAGKINIARSPSPKSRERFVLAVAAWLKVNMHR